MIPEYLRCQPVAPGATGTIRQSHRELQEDEPEATKSVVTNQNSWCDWQTSPVRTGNVAPILTFHGLLFTYWWSQINGALDLASNDGAVECHLLLAGPVG